MLDGAVFVSAGPTVVVLLGPAVAVSAGTAVRNFSRFLVGGFARRLTWPFFSILISALPNLRVILFSGRLSRLENTEASKKEKQ